MNTVQLLPKETKQNSANAAENLRYAALLEAKREITALKRVLVAFILTHGTKNERKSKQLHNEPISVT